MGNEPSSVFDTNHAQKPASSGMECILNTIQNHKTIFDEWDEIDDEEEAKKTIVNHLLKKQELDSDIFIKLDFHQREELKRGIQCLTRKYLIQMTQQLNCYQNVDDLNDAQQIKMYNYLLKAIKQQEKDINDVNVFMEEKTENVNASEDSDDEDMVQDLNKVEIIKINKFVTQNFVENCQPIQNILIKERITINHLCNIKSLDKLNFIAKKLRLNKQQANKLSQYTKYHYSTTTYNKKIITMRATNGNKSIILRCLNNAEILSCIEYEHPCMEDQDAYRKSLYHRIELKLNAMGLSSVTNKPYRWLKLNHLNDKQLMCRKITQINTMGEDEYVLEQSIKIYINGNHESKYHFPTENFKKYGAEYCKHVPSDVVIKFNDKQYDIYKTANDIGLKNNGTILIGHRTLNEAMVTIVYRDVDSFGCAPSSVDVNIEQYTVFDLKYLISKSKGIYQDILQLYYGGGILKDEQKLSDFDFTKQYMLYYVVRLSGS